MIWMTFSLLLVSTFTALLTSGITEKSISLDQRKVALVCTPHFKQIIVSQRGIPICTDNYDDAFRKVRDGEVFAALADTNTVAKLQDKLWKDYSLDVGTTFPTDQGVYMLLQNEDWEANAKFWECISASTKYLSMDKLKPNPDSEVLQAKTVIIILGVLASFAGLLIIVGIVKHAISYTAAAKGQKQSRSSVSSIKGNMAFIDGNDGLNLKVMQPSKYNWNDKYDTKINTELRSIAKTVKAQGEAIARIEKMLSSKANI